MSANKQYGVTPPLCEELPNDAQKRDSEALLEELRQQGTFETASETQLRWKVLASLQNIADAFVKAVATIKMGGSEPHIRDARGKIFTYGSFRLGVYGPGSDIDTLVVAPRYVTREDYFKLFPDLLVKMAPPGAITDLKAVTDAYVPIIKFEYSGISIDLIFSRIHLAQLPTAKTWDLKDSNLLRGLDEAEMRSLNGTRVTDEIINLVPEQQTFREALRAIKLWAQRRAIYANIMGFPGGVAWAMLVARVCQLYPKATCSHIVARFFHVILRWPWPNPVLLKPIEEGNLPVRVWNPKIYKGDSFHLMPIITPAYPSMCATYNITKSSMEVIKRELSRASDLCNLITMGKRPWKDLFEKHTFFTKDYKYFISVVASSTEKEPYKAWSGFVESKVRMLVQDLERHPSIALARPFNKGYERVSLCKEFEQVEQVQNGSLAYVIRKTEELPKGDTKSEVAEVQVKAAGAAAPEEKATEVPAAGVKPEPVATNGAVKQEADTESEAKSTLADTPLASKTEAGSDAPQKSETEVDAKLKLEDLLDQGLEIYTQTHYIGIELKKVGPYLAQALFCQQDTSAKSLDLSKQVASFKQTCYFWEKYREELSDTCLISINHDRAFDLPDDIFEPGEVKPTKATKRRVQPKTPSATADAAASKKRGPPDDMTAAPKRQQTNVAPVVAG